MILKKFRGLLYVILIVKSVQIDLNHGENKECCLLSRFSIWNNQFVTLTQFESLSQLKFNCSQPSNLTILKIFPYKPLVLDDSLDLHGLTIRVTGDFFSILLENFKGFALQSNPFDQITFLNYPIEKIWWRFSHLGFNFFLNSTSLKKTCCNINLPGWKIFSMIRFLDLLSIQFAQDTCPFVFKNANIRLMNIDRLISSFIEKNIFQFANVSIASLELNCSIFQVQLVFYRTDLTENLLNKHVFKNLAILDLNGPFNSIQHDLFKSFDYLRMIRLRSTNVRRVFAQNNKWLNSLNRRVNVDLDDLNDVDSKLWQSIMLVIYQAFSNVSFYEFPDEDFCLFKLFPHERLVLPKLKPARSSKCSCTEIFLIQYSFNFATSIERNIYMTPTSYAYIEYYTETVFDKYFSICINNSIRMVLLKCDFPKRLRMCDIQQANNNNNKSNSDSNQDFFNVYDWSVLTESIQIIINKNYINLICSNLGILTNLAFILILSNKKIMKDKMYTYLLINSFFNLFYSVSLTIKFAFGYLEQNSIDYMEFTSTIQSQYINLIIGKICSNIFRTVSNIAYLSFTLSRYIKIKNEKNSFLSQFHKLNVKLFLFISLTIAMIINAHIFFGYKIKYSQKDHEQLHAFSGRNFSNYYKQESIDEYKENFSSQSEYYLLNISQYVRIIFSDLAHIIVSTIIDIVLFGFVKKQIRIKKTLVNANQVLSLIAGQSVNKKKLNKNHVKSHDRISTMIILNGINFLLLRFPIALLSFYGFVFRYNKYTKKYEPDLVSYIICKTIKLCGSLQETFTCLYLVSFIVQFFIFYCLDNNFKESLLQLKLKIFKKKST